MKTKLSRRDFIKLSGACSVFLTGCSVFNDDKSGGNLGSLTGTALEDTDKTYSVSSEVELEKVPSACWQCVARDGIIAYKEDGRITHLRGNPKLLRTSGKLCARGQGGIGQVYDPDRILFPMKRTGNRGSGSWKRITWDEAKDEIVSLIKPLYDNGTPGKFMFHYGRMKASSSKMIKDYFLTAFGTETIGDHTAICEAAKQTGQELTWGSFYDVNDVENTKFILNFGCNVNEAHVAHVTFSQRLVKAMADNAVPMHTFDVRLSNTAAKSTSWIPIKPGTDLSVVLAMIYHLLVTVADTLPQAGKDFINTWSTTTIDDLTTHFVNKGYTPEWAEEISGVPAATIKSLAEAFVTNTPSTIISYRGAIAHYNGTMTEIAIQTLEALAGNIEVQGGRVHPVDTSWGKSWTTPTAPVKSKISVLSNDKLGKPPYPTHEVSQRILENIAAKYDAGEDIPTVYMIYCYNPVYANGDWERNVEILEDTSIIPNFIAVDVAYSDSSHYADIILPDATYLERWDWEDMVSYNFIPEYYIRQPVISPLGEAKDFKDFVCDELASALGIDLGFTSAEEFVQDAVENTTDLTAAGITFDYMKENGAWYDETKAPTYGTYKTQLTSVDNTHGYIKDSATGVWWKPKNSAGTDLTFDSAAVTFTDPATSDVLTPESDGTLKNALGVEFSYRDTTNAYKNYKGQEISGTIYKGFKPDKLNKSGKFEIYSPLLVSKGLTGYPEWVAIPEHESLASDEFILTTYKMNVQAQSRTQNCKYLSERYHENFALINTATAAALGISDGDTVIITNAEKTATDFLDPTKTLSQATTTKTIEIKARVTQGVHPKCIAISHHCGHSHYGRYATAGQQTNPMAAETEQASQISTDTDSSLIWWESNGTHPNHIIPNDMDFISGQMRFNDTVVTVAKKS